MVMSDQFCTLTIFSSVFHFQFLPYSKFCNLFVQAAPVVHMVAKVSFDRQSKQVMLHLYSWYRWPCKLDDCNEDDEDNEYNEDDNGDINETFQIDLEDQQCTLRDRTRVPCVQVNFKRQHHYKITIITMTAITLTTIAMTAITMTTIPFWRKSLF